MKRKGGIRDRLGLNPEPKAAASSAGAAASSSGDSGPLRGGIRRRLEDTVQRPPEDTPFTDSLKQRWAEGNISSHWSRNLQ